MRGRPCKNPEAEERHELLAFIEAKRHNMQQSCRTYNPKPFYEMGNSESLSFSQRQAREASRTIRLSKHERERYIAAIYSSILYFNNRSKEHAAHMRYLQECRKMREEEEQRRAEEEREQKRHRVFVYIN